MPIIIRIGQRAARHVPSTPLTVGLVGTSIQDSGESAPDYGMFYDIPSVAEAEARFGTGVSARREGSIVEAVKLIDLHRLPPIKAAAVDVSTGLHQAAVRTAINSTVDAMPTEVTLLAAPGLTVNYDASGDSLTTVCSTVARLQARAVAARGIAITDTAFDTVANAISYLGVAGNTGSRVMPMALRLEGASGIAHPASSYAIGAILRHIDERGAQANWSGIPVDGVTRQEVEALRTAGDVNSDVARIRAAGGSVIAWSGSEWKLYGGILGGATNTDLERFASVRRVEDIIIDRLYTAFEPFEEQNLTRQTIPSAIAVGKQTLRRARSEGLIDGFTLSADDDYNTLANLQAQNIGFGLTIDVYTPISTLQLTVNFDPFVPSADGEAA